MERMPVIRAFQRRGLVDMGFDFFFMAGYFWSMHFGAVAKSPLHKSHHLRMPG